ncbi:BQ2448_6416 [Microbotryum intermedium]|uniref:BQ2448_6416 protein n=1 Tax=Microbotryum intermedium TaxID=269621 RepID=A0A238FSA0_9BASI|nr:BQ2448_6416 [Microbotryum intermedium]
MDHKTVLEQTHSVHVIAGDSGSRGVDADGRASVPSSISSSSVSSAVDGGLGQCSASPTPTTHPAVSCSSPGVPLSSSSSSVAQTVPSWSLHQQNQVRESDRTPRKRSHDGLVEPSSWPSESNGKSHAISEATMALLRPLHQYSRRVDSVKTWVAGKQRLHRAGSVSAIISEPREGNLREASISVSHRGSPSEALCDCLDRTTSSISLKRIRTDLSTLTFGAIQRINSNDRYSVEVLKATGEHGTPNGRDTRLSNHRRLGCTLPLSYSGSFAHKLNNGSLDKTTASSPAKATQSTGLATTVPFQPHEGSGPDRPYRRGDSATSTRSCLVNSCLLARSRSCSAPPTLFNPCLTSIHSQSETMALDAPHPHSLSSASACETTSASTSVAQEAGSPSPSFENGQCLGAHRVHEQGSVQAPSMPKHDGTRPLSLTPSAAASFLLPPITRTTLKELDLHDILQSAQLRHDIVFEPNVMFRPNYDGERGERKKRAAERYWHAVSRELVLGCRCTAFAGSERLACVCQNTRGTGCTATETMPLWPSRIPALVLELRNIVLSLLPTPLNGVAQEEVMEMLDPAFICQQVGREGLLDVGKLADYLGVTLKTHCAPMRDHMIDEMVRICQGDDASVALGLRLCFEILELMKLDIANHQLRSFRPYLVRTAVDFERSHLRPKFSPEGSKRVRDWLLKSCPDAGSSVRDRVSQSVSHGVLDLVFSSVAPSSTQPALPFTFQLDALRLKTYRNEATDLTVVYMLMMLFQQLVPSSRQCVKDLLELRQCIGSVISTANAEISQSTATGKTASTESRAKAATMQGTVKFDLSEWRHELKQAGTLMASFATKLGATAKEVAPAGNSNMVHDMPTLVENYIDTHLRADSKLFLLLRSRLQASVTAAVQDELARETETKGAPWWMRPPISPPPSQFSITLDPRRSRRTGCTSERSSDIVPVEVNLMAKSAPTNRGTKRAPIDEQDCTEKRARYTAPGTEKIDPPLHSPDLNTLLVRNGLTPLTDQIKSLGDRIAKLTSFHLAVHSDFYQACWTFEGDL